MATETECLKALELHGAELYKLTNVVGIGARANEQGDDWGLVVYLASPTDTMPCQLFIPGPGNQVVTVQIIKEVIGELGLEH